MTAFNIEEDDPANNAIKRTASRERAKAQRGSELTACIGYMCITPPVLPLREAGRQLRVRFHRSILGGQYLFNWWWSSGVLGIFYSERVRVRVRTRARMQGSLFTRAPPSGRFYRVLTSLLIHFPLREQCLKLYSLLYLPKS